MKVAPRTLPALAHVLPVAVKASFELVIEEITDFIERKQLEKCRRAEGERVTRITNSVESWHYGLQACFKGIHTEYLVALAELKKVLKMQKFQFT